MSTSHPINGGRPSAGHLRQNSIFDSDSPIEDEWHHDGDYATRLEEVLSESEDSDTGASRVRAAFGDDDDDDGDAFVYDGKDAEPAGTYRDQLREVLEEDMGSYDEYLEEAEVDKSLQVVSGSVIGSDVGQVKCTLVTHYKHRIDCPVSWTCRLHLVRVQNRSRLNYHLPGLKDTGTSRRFSPNRRTLSFTRASHDFVRLWVIQPTLGQKLPVTTRYHQARVTFRHHLQGSLPRRILPHLT